MMTDSKERYDNYKALIDEMKLPSEEKPTMKNVNKDL